MINKLLMATLFLCSICLFSQEILVIGNVYDEYLEPFSGAKIRSSHGKSVLSDSDGVFKIKVTIPIKLTVSAEGFQDEIVNIVDDEEISLVLKEKSLLNEIVMSGTRTSERMFESPVSIRRLGKKEMRRTTAKDFYSALSDLPDINMYNQSSSLQVPNTRGFTNAKNFRFIQLVDGMDNIVPSDNMYGNLVGAIGLDVANVEVLPGASSALYGSNAFNGAILMTSKNPFDETGISIKTTGGITNQEIVTNQKIVETKGFHDIQARLAYRFSESFAASASFSHGGGEEWYAQDYRNKIGGVAQGGGIADRGINYNGVNVFGDEKTYNTKLGTFSKYRMGLITLEDYNRAVNINVSRTGYKEKELLENHYGNRKFHTSLHFRPLKNDKLNVIWRSKFSNADPFIFHGVGGRYENSLNHSTHLLEVNSDVFFVRSYYSSFDINYKSTELLGFKLNNSALSDGEWFSLYNQNYQQNLNDKQARTFADNNRLRPGTAKFNQVKNRLNNTHVSDGGVVSLELSNFMHYEGNINLKKYIGWDVLLGASHREYNLASDGTLYSDISGGEPIDLHESSVYGQVKRKFLDDRLLLLTSLRYDDTKNFKGQYSPRVSASYTLGEDKNHSLRFTYQTAFRNPSIQDQYFGYQLGNFYAIGSTDDNHKRLEGKKLYKDKPVIDYINKAGFTAQSWARYTLETSKRLNDNSTAAGVVAAVKESVNFLNSYSFKEKELKSENVQAISFGYRGLFNTFNKIFELDLDTYISNYSNFIANKTILIPLSDNADVNAEKIIDAGDPPPFSQALSDVRKGNNIVLNKPVNSEENIVSYGLVLNIKTKILNDFDASLSYSWAKSKILNNSEDLQSNQEFHTSGFNMPEHNIKFMLAKDNLFKNLGFSLSYKFQNKFIWESAFVTGYVPVQNLIDAQVSYPIPKLKSRFKLGVNNLLGKNYNTNLGVGQMGSTVFLAWTIND